MRTKINEESDYNVMLKTLEELTQGYDPEGNKVAAYFDIHELMDNFGITMEEAIDIAENNGYNVYRLPGGDNLVNQVIIAHGDLSYGDIVKEEESETEVDDSFDVEEDYMNDLKILKYKYCVEVVDRDNNFIDRKFFMTRPQADKYVDTFNDVLFDEKINQDELVELENGKDFIGTLIKVIIEKRREESLEEDIDNPLVGKKVNYRGEDCTIEDVDDDGEDVFLKLSNGKQVSVSICVDKGFITSDDADVNALFDRFKVEDVPEEEPKHEPERPVDSKDAVVQQALNDAREDWYEYKATSPMFKMVKQARKTGKYDKIPTAYPELYADTYYKEFKRLKDSVESRLAKNYFGVIERTYPGEVDELIEWLRRAITNIRVTSGDATMPLTQERVDFFNDRDGTDVKISRQNNKIFSSWIADLTQKEDILKDMPPEVLDWKIDKNNGRAFEEDELGVVYNQKNNELGSNAVVLDLLAEYDFKLGKQKANEELEEGFMDTIDLEYYELDIETDNGPTTIHNFTYHADKDEVLKALEILTDRDVEDIEARFDHYVDKYNKDLLDTFRSAAEEAGADDYNENPEVYKYVPSAEDEYFGEDFLNDEVVEETNEYKIVKTIQHNFRTVKGVARKGKDKVIYQVYFRTQDYNPAVGRWMNRGWTNSTSEHDSIESAREYVKKYGKTLKSELEEDASYNKDYLSPNNIHGRDARAEKLIKTYANESNWFVKSSLGKKRPGDMGPDAGPYTFEQAYKEFSTYKPEGNHGTGALKIVYREVLDNDDEIKDPDDLYIVDSPMSLDTVVLTRWFKDDEEIEDSKRVAFRKKHQNEGVDLYEPEGGVIQVGEDKVSKFLDNIRNTKTPRSLISIGNKISREVNLGNISREDEKKLRDEIAKKQNQLVLGEEVKEIQVRDNENIEKDAEECPLPLEMIPNEMGINLSNVEKVKWEEQDDGQLKKVEIEFNPASPEELDEDNKTQEYRGYKIVFHPGYNMWVNMKDYYKVYNPKGTLVGGKKTIESAKELVDKRIAGKNDVYEEVEVEEDIEKHDTLNSKLFDGEELKPEVADKIEQIAYQFVKELNDDGIRFTLKDIVLLGSNVSYNYTKDSDLDIHLIADSSGLECPDELYPLLYSAYRSMFNKNYDIKIKGIPAEIYVEMDEPVAKSNGIYSLNNGWLKKPEQRDIPDLDEEAFDKLFNEWEDKYFDLMEKDATSEDIENFIEDLYDLRKESIATEGEYGLGNLVFKEFRNMGYLDGLKDLRKEKKGKELSLEHLDEDKELKSLVCPHCGGNLFTKKDNNIFKCLHCDTEFFISDNDTDVHSDEQDDEDEPETLSNKIFRKIITPRELSKQAIRNFKDSNPQFKNWRNESKIVEDLKSEDFWNLRNIKLDITGNLVQDGDTIRPLSDDELAGKYAVSIEHADKGDLKTRGELEAFAKEIGADRIMFYYEPGDNYSGEYSFLLSGPDANEIAKRVKREYDQKDYAIFDAEGKYHPDTENDDK